jgi:hypothetical protein
MKNLKSNASLMMYQLGRQSENFFEKKTRWMIFNHALIVSVY